MRAARGIQVVNTVWALAECAEVFFVPAAFSPKSKDFYDLKGKGPRIFPVSRHLGPFKSQFLFVLKILPLARKMTVLFTRHLKTAWWLLKFRPLHERPVVYEVHEIFKEKNKGLAGLETFVLQKANGLITVSKGLEKEISAQFKVLRIVSIPNGTRAGRPFNPDKLLGTIDKVFYVGSSRYFWKGTSLLSQVAGLLPPEIKLVIVGNGSPKNLDSKVELLGFHPPARTYQILEKAALTVLPNSRKNRQSRFYTCPLKLLDYMASGCAIVASDLPSIREIVSPEEALLVSPDDAPALAEGIKRLLVDQKLRLSLGRAAYEKAKEFSWEKRATKLKRFLQEVAH